MGLLDIFYHGPETLKIVSPPVGVYHDLARANPVTLQLREKILSLGGDDFSITDAATGKGVLKCRGVTFTMHERKKITDADGNLLFNINQQVLTIGKTFVGADKVGTEVLRLKKKMSLGSKLEATFLDNGKELVAEVNGDFWGGSASIVLKDGTRLAHIARKPTAADAVVDKQTYYVTVAPGVDIALMATLCILFDEAKNEEGGVDILSVARRVF